MNARGIDAPRLNSAIARAPGPDDPEQIGPFLIVGLLGAGSMGEVYLGTAEGRYVAVKRVRPHLVTAARFQREVRILHQVPDGVAPVVRASDGIASRPWFATDYVPGLTVQDAVSRTERPLDPDVLWLLLAETAAQLSIVHDAGIVHRDLKPANVMLVRDGVVLIDFGIARAADQARLTRTGGSFGTPGFAAPEQYPAPGDDIPADGADPGPPADVFSLGALLRYAGTGSARGTAADLESIRAADPGLADVIESCLAVDPAARPTAAELVDRARERVSAANPSWPDAALELIEAREEFLATPVDRIETIAPEDDGPQEVSEQPETPASPTPEKPRESKATEKRRRSILLAPIATVIVVGGITAFVLVPYVSPIHTIPRASGTASSGVARLLDQTGSRSASSSPSASPSASATTGAPTSTADSTHQVSGSDVTSSAEKTTAASVAGPKGPSTDTNYYPGSEVTVAGCAGWIDFNGDADNVGTLWGTLSAGDASCSAHVITTNSNVGGEGTVTLQAADYKVTGDNPAWYGYVGSYHFTEQICIWNVAAPSVTACSAKYTDNSNTVSKG